MRNEENIPDAARHGRLMGMVAAFILLVTAASPARAELVWSDGAAGDDEPATVGYDLLSAGPASAPMTAQAPATATPVASTVRASAFSATASLLTTCTGLVNNFPQNTVNYFFPEKHEAVYYFAYILLSPPHSGSHSILNEWYDPDGKLLCRKEVQAEVKLENSLLTLSGESYLYYVFTNSIGLKEMRPDSGQSALAVVEGLYYIKLTVDGQTTGLTFFRLIHERARPIERIEEIRRVLGEKGGREAGAAPSKDSGP